MAFRGVSRTFHELRSPDRFEIGVCFATQLRFVRPVVEPVNPHAPHRGQIISQRGVARPLSPTPFDFTGGRVLGAGVARVAPVRPTARQTARV